MSTTIFHHTDSDGDGFEVSARTHVDSDDTLILTATSDDGDEVQAFIPRATVDRLRAALAPYGTEAAAKPVALADIVVGREYRLLPDSAYAVGEQSVFVDDRATRVRVVQGPDMDGDVYVSALDGLDPGFSAHVDAKYLAPLTDPSDAAVAALRANLTEAEAQPAPLDPRRVAAVKEAIAILGGEGHTVDTDSLLVIAEFLVEAA